MENYTEKFTLPRYTLPIVTVVLGVALLIALLCLGKDKEPGDLVPAAPVEVSELLVQNVTVQDDTVLVETTYGTVRYPHAFSDIMSVEAATFENHATLEFTATIDDTTHKLYTLLFNGEEGMPVGVLRNGDERYVVTVQFHDANGISDNNMSTFYATQETLNDVLNSLSENKGFIAAD